MAAWLQLQSFFDSAISYVTKAITYDDCPFLKRDACCLFPLKKTAFTQASLFKKGRLFHMVLVVSFKHQTQTLDFLSAKEDPKSRTLGI